MINSKIQELDLKCISLKAVELGLISNEESKNSEYLYRIFLFLKKTYPNKKIIPTHQVDMFWHCHILFTQKYFEDCNKIFGYYLHHHPVSNQNHIDNMSTYREDTLRLVRLHFPGFI